MRHNYKHNLVVLLLPLILLGCSQRPADQVIQKQITDQLLANERDKIYEVRNFTKTNGWQESDYAYVAEVQYDLVYKTDLAGAMKILESQSGSIIGGGLSAMALGMAYGNFKMGDVRSLQEQYTFIKTEKGWLLKQE